MEANIISNQKLIKRKLIELAKAKRELLEERSKNINIITKALTPKLETDILTLDKITEEYGLHERTIYRYRAKGLKCSKSGLRGFVFIVRKDLEDYLKRDMYDR